MSAADHLTTAGYAGPPLDTDQLQAARFWVAHHRPYYASVLYRCPVVLTDRIPTLAVDVHWRLYINASFAATLSVTELATVLIHEVNHLIRDHAGRARTVAAHTDAGATHWNIAADAEINDDLFHDGLSAPDWVLPSSFGCLDDDVAEHYYAVLVEMAEDAPAAVTTRDGDDDGHDPRHGTATGTRRADGADVEVDGAGDHEHPDDDAGPRCGPGAGGAAFDGQIDPDDPMAPAVSSAEAEILRRRVAEEIERRSTTPGSVPGGLVAWARETLRPTVDWRSVLAATLRAGVAEVAGTADYTYRRFSRRSQAVPQVRLPGMLARFPTVAVVVDTSGSMSNDQLAQAFGELQSILRSCGVVDQSVAVLTVDVDVTVHRRVRDLRAITQIGRGGTDMSAGIIAAAELRPSPDLIVVLTDGYTPWPDEAPRAQVIVGLVGESVCDEGIPDFATVVPIPLAH